MKRYLRSAELIKYNANARGKRTGDCVNRTISLAFDISYTEANQLLNCIMREERAHSWKVSKVYGQLIKELGGSSQIKMKEENVTVAEFADTIAKPGKCYIIECGKTFKVSTHLVCIRDQKIIDSWDCSDYIVSAYYTVDSNKPLRELTDIKSRIKDLASDYATDIIESEFEKWKDNKQWPNATLQYKMSQSDYQINYICRVKIAFSDLVKKMRNYDFTISLVFAPTMTDEEAIEYINKTAKTRAYDRMYSINTQENKLIEAALVAEEAGGDVDPLELEWQTDQEVRFINSLPGWVRPLLRYVDIQNPGRYSNSYTIKIIPHPYDIKNSKNRRLVFEAWDSNQMRDMLDRYYKNGELPYVDYSPSEYY